MLATVGIILAAAYVLWMVQRTTQGTVNPALASVDKMRKDLTAREVVVVTPLIVLILFLGFYPKPVIDVINPAVRATLSQIGSHRSGPDRSDERCWRRQVKVLADGSFTAPAPELRRRLRRC